MRLALNMDLVLPLYIKSWNPYHKLWNFFHALHLIKRIMSYMDNVYNYDIKTLEVLRVKIK